MIELVGLLRRYRAEHARLAQIRKQFRVTIEPHVVIKGPLAHLRLGAGVVIQSGTVLHLGGMKWCHGQGHLEIGDRSCLSPHCVIYAGGPGGVRIGRKFDCGPGVGIFASRTDYLRGPDHHVFAPVTVGDSVIVFAHAVIGPGVTIGDGAVIAAGAVVTGDVPAHSLVGGIPARVIRENIHDAERRESSWW